MCRELWFFIGWITLKQDYKPSQFPRTKIFFRITESGRGGKRRHWPAELYLRVLAEPD